MSDSQFLPFQDTDGDLHNDVCKLDDIVLEVKECPTCIPNEAALVPDWKTQTEPFLNEKNCKYQISYKTNETTTGYTSGMSESESKAKTNEIFQEYEEDAITELLEFYNKETTTGAIALIQASIEYTAYDLEARPNSRLKLLYSIPHDVLNAVENEAEDEDGSEEETGDITVTYNTSDLQDKLLRVRKGLKLYNRYYRIFSATSAEVQRFVYVSGPYDGKEFVLQNYGDFGLGINAGGKRAKLELVYDDLAKFLKQKGFSIRLESLFSFGEPVTKIEMTFNRNYKIIKLKVFTEKCGIKPTVYTGKLDQLRKLNGWKDKTAVAYFAQLDNMDQDLQARTPKAWADFIKDYTYPNVELKGANEALAGEQTAPGCVAQAIQNKVSDGSLFDLEFSFSDALALKWYDTYCNSSQEELSILKQQLGAVISPETAALGGITPSRPLRFEDMYEAAKQQAYNKLQAQNDPLSLICVGGAGDLSFSGNILFDLKICGLEAALTQAITCLFGGLSLEEALSSVVKSALSSMSIEKLNDLFIGLPPEQQAELNELAQKKLKEGDLFKSDSTNQQLSDAIASNNTITLQDFIGGRTFDYREFDEDPKDRVEGWFESGATTNESDPNAQRRTLAQRFDNPSGSVKEEQVVAAYVAALLEYYSDNLLELVDQLNRFPGARLISNALLAIDCPRPPLFNPGVFEFIRDLELPFCRNIDDITLPKLVNPFAWVPDISDILGALFAALKSQIEELVISILLKLFLKICDIIGSAICKALETVGSIAAGLVTGGGRDELNAILRNAICGEDASQEDIDKAITEMLANFGVGAQAFANQEQTLSLAESMANTMSRKEMADAFLGNMSPDAAVIMSDIIDSEYPEFSEALSNTEQISQMFKSMGDLFPASFRDTLADVAAGIPEEDITPVNPSLCATPEQLEEFCSARASILEGRASPEQIELLCNTQANTDDLSDLQSALQGNYIENNMPPITSDPGCDNGLLPYEPDETIQTVVAGLGSDLEMLQIDYTTDMLGNGPREKNWGMINMMMSDTQGLPLTAHIRKASINPFYVDQYGTFFPDPSIVVAAGLANPAAAIILNTLDQSNKNGAFPNKLASYLQIYMDGQIDTEIISVDYNNDFVTNKETNLKQRNDIKLSFSDYGDGLTYRDYEERLNNEKRSAYDYGFDVEGYTAEIQKIDNNEANIYSDNIRIKIVERNNIAAKNLIEQSTTINPDFSPDPGTSLEDIFNLEDKAAPIRDENIETETKYEFLAVDDTFAELNEELEKYTSFYKKFLNADNYQPQTHLLKSIIGVERIDMSILEQYRSVTSTTILNDMFATIADKESEISAWTYGAQVETLTQQDTDYGINDNGLWVPYKDSGLTEEDMILGISYDQYKNEVSGTIEKTRVFYLDPEDFGGSYRKPGIYIKPPEFKGWFGLIDILFPDYSPCRPRSTNLIDFDNIKETIDEIYPNIPEDERLKSDPDCIVELPYNRVLERPAKAGMMGLIIATCRIFTSAHIIKTLPTFAKFAPNFPEVYSSVYASYIVENIEDSFRNEVRADWEGLGGLSDTDFWYGFLEQCVQMYAYRIDIGDVEPSETVLQALSRLNDLQSEYEYPLSRSDVRGDIGLLQTLKSYRQEKNLEAIQKTEEDAKIIMKEWVVEQLNYMSRKLINSLDEAGFTPEIKDIDYYILEKFTSGALLTINQNIDSDGNIMATYKDLPTIPFEDNEEVSDPYYTYGGELIVEEVAAPTSNSLKVGQEYVGFYHVHLNETGDIIYMTGEYHGTEPHDVLTPISNIATVPIGDVAEIGDADTSKSFKIEKYISIDGTRYPTAEAMEIIRQQDQTKLVSEVYPGTMRLITNEDGVPTGISGAFGLRYGLKFSIVISDTSYEITSVELDALDLTLNNFTSLSANSIKLYCLIKELKKDPKFKMLTRYIVPVSKLVSMTAIYNDMALLPSIGQVIVSPQSLINTNIEEKLSSMAGSLPDTINTGIEEIQTSDFEPAILWPGSEGAWAHPDDRKNRNGLFVLSWDNWSREILSNSTSRIKKIFKSYYNSRDFDSGETTEEGPGKIFERNLKNIFRPSPGKQILPWYKRRQLRDNPFNSLGEICKKEDS
jgi:hypothetical protein